MVACQYPQRRNPATGRCKKPCSNHQAINPRTGRCVTKTYLKSLRRQTYGGADLTYVGSAAFSNPYFGATNSTRDARQGLVYDAACYPRKRNLLTGRCKTPCDYGYAINPATDRCVTKEYLRRLNPDDYDTDDDDDMVSRILFTPTDIGSHAIMVNLPDYMNSDSLMIAAGSDASASNASVKTDKQLLASSALSKADIGVMSGIFKSSAKDAKPSFLAGTYSPKLRKQSCGRTDISSHSECGIANIAKEIDETLMTATKSNADLFLWSVWHNNHFDPKLIDFAVEMSAQTHIRLLFLTEGGLWRVLIPHTEGDEAKTLLKTTWGMVKPLLENITMGAARETSINISEFNASGLHISYATYGEESK